MDTIELSTVSYEGDVCHLAFQTFRSADKPVSLDIPADLADQLGLAPGLILSGQELEDIKSGRVPNEWDSIDNRHDYRTPIGIVCMSGREYREYREKKGGR